MNKSKIISYLLLFKKRAPKILRIQKKFWEFYKSSIKISSDKSQSNHPKHIIEDEISVIDPDAIATLFNNFFTSITSVSLSGNDECVEFTDSLFNNLKKEKKLKTAISGFSFRQVDIMTIKELIQKMPSSSPGSSCINSKVLKLLPETLAPVYTKLFNYCIATNSIPADWKSAIVTPLFKNKGKQTELNNYSGISVISPIAKLFEKVLAL